MLLVALERRTEDADEVHVRLGAQPVPVLRTHEVADTGLEALVFFAVLAAAGFSIWRVWRDAHTYGY